jgi:high-affinity nickel-transport protein
MSARMAQIRDGLTAAEWRRVGILALVIVALHVIGFGVLLGVVVPGGMFGLGVGITAYTLGLRHAFDADHIAAIDNTTRKLMAEGQRPVSVGFFFSLGHSTIVFGLAALFALGAASVHTSTGILGPAISGVFLVAIGVVNLMVLVSILGISRRMRNGSYDEAELEAELNKRGFMNRFYARTTRGVSKPWHMYPVGMLFGLGFDTATEVALLAAAGAAAAGGMPFYAILCLPVLFAAGMSLLDTIDGAFMNFAYGWAFSRPVRKIFYNITITGLSVAVALIVGSFELLSVLADKLGLTGGLWDAVAGLDLNVVGYAIVALFVVTWALALAVWHFGHIEEKWSARLEEAA